MTPLTFNPHRKYIKKEKRKKLKKLGKAQKEWYNQELKRRRAKQKISISLLKEKR